MFEVGFGGTCNEMLTSTAGSLSCLLRTMEAKTALCC